MWTKEPEYEAFMYVRQRHIILYFLRWCLCKMDFGTQRLLNELIFFVAGRGATKINSDTSSKLASSIFLWICFSLSGDSLTRFSRSNPVCSFPACNATKKFWRGCESQISMIRPERKKNLWEFQNQGWGKYVILVLESWGSSLSLGSCRRRFLQCSTKTLEMLYFVVTMGASHTVELRGRRVEPPPQISQTHRQSMCETEFQLAIQLFTDTCIERKSARHWHIYHVAKDKPYCCITKMGEPTFTNVMGIVEEDCSSVFSPVSSLGSSQTDSLAQNCPMNPVT